MLIPPISWNNLLKCLYPAEEPLYCVALLVVFWIKPEWPPPFRLFPRSSVDRDVALDSPVPAVLTNFPGIVGRICRDDRRTILHLWNLECFEGWFVEPGIMDIGRCNHAGKWETMPIDQSTQLAPFCLFIAIIAGRSPLFAGVSLVSVEQCERSIFQISYPDRSNSRKIAWYTPFSHNSRWYR